MRRQRREHLAHRQLASEGERGSVRQLKEQMSFKFWAMPSSSLWSDPSSSDVPYGEVQILCHRENEAVVSLRRQKRVEEQRKEWAQDGSSTAHRFLAESHAPLSDLKEHKRTSQ